MSGLVVQKNFLSELLPYEASTKINGSLRAGLKEYSLLLEATKQAMMAIQSGDLEQFDAVVGENACQIRAVKIAMAFPRYLEVVESVQAQIAIAQQKVEKLSQSLEPFMSSGVSLQTLLESQGLDIALTAEELFLVESFLLSVAKTVKASKASSPLCRNDAADPKKLKQFGKDVSTSFTDNLVRKTRKLLSIASVGFVREQAKSLGDKELEEMSSDRFTVSYNSWPCVPMFWTYKTLLLAAQKMGVPLVMWAKFLSKDMEYLHCP
ncbi:MAG: hypothetical protein JSS61_04175 [Verrucomicrobia bacterium]|nr:hypothetical protein [Verrucomicrobiota bacterium]